MSSIDTAAPEQMKFSMLLTGKLGGVDISGSTPKSISAIAKDGIGFVKAPCSKNISDSVSVHPGESLNMEVTTKDGPSYSNNHNLDMLCPSIAVGLLAFLKAPLLS